MFEVSLRRLSLLLAVVAAVLIACGLAVGIARLGFGHDYIMGFASRFDLALEATVPAWFSSFLLVLAAALLALIYRRERLAGDHFSGHWLGLAVIFLYLSIDEAAELHELLGPVMRGFFDLKGVLYYGWMIPAAALLMVLSVVYFRFLCTLPARICVIFVAAAVLYVGGALGFELVGSKIDFETGNAGWGYFLFSALEESLEMFGVIVFIHGLVLILAGPSGQLRIGSEANADQSLALDSS